MSIASRAGAAPVRSSMGPAQGSTQGSAKGTTIVVIPARFASSRFPGKPLAEIRGRPMVQWVHDRARGAKGVDRVIVATDDERIACVVAAFGGEAMLTSPSLASGTDRMAAVAEQVEGDVFVNVQGDEPLIAAEAIEAAARLVREDGFPMATVMSPLLSQAELDDPSVVKVIADQDRRAIYFSRLPIPYSRGPRPGPGAPFACRRHVGLYAFTRPALMRFRDLSPSPLEQGEVLEQLRALENGIPIGIAEVAFESIGVDTPEDLERVRRILEKS